MTEQTKRTNAYQSLKAKLGEAEGRISELETHIVELRARMGRLETERVGESMANARLRQELASARSTGQ